MFVLVRALTYATLFVGLLLVYVPSSVLTWSGITSPGQTGWQQIAGMALGTAGALLTGWCLFAFVFAGKGTPAPFDPPRRLVVQGPYRFVRNPMYIGAILALLGASLYYTSVPLLAYAVLFFVASHLFVVLYEEPVLRRRFGDEYEVYCKQIGRWWP